MTFAAAASHASGQGVRPTGVRRLARIAGLALIEWSQEHAAKAGTSWNERALANEIARGAADLQQRREASLSGYVVAR